MSRSKPALLAVTVALALLALPSVGAALIPPLDEQELTEQADLIVTGKVTAVVEDGAGTSDSCYRWQGYKATLAVEATHKGAEHKELTVRYATRLGDVDPKRPCDGGRDSYSLQSGGRYKLYLSARGAVAAPFHRNGVKRL
jgi:hypothetical protein